MDQVGGCMMQSACCFRGGAGLGGRDRDAAYRSRSRGAFLSFSGGVGGGQEITPVKITVIEDEIINAFAANINADKKVIKKLFRWVEYLRARIVSQLLGPAGPGDSERRRLVFMETELSIFAAFLMTLSNPRHSDLRRNIWLEDSFMAVPDLADRVFREVASSRHTTLLERAAQCFRRRNSEGYSYDKIHQIPQLHRINENLCRYMYLLVTSSEPGLTPQLAKAEAGALALAGIHRPVKKILRWITHQGNINRTLRVMSIVGPVGIGKTTLAMELRNRLTKDTCGFQCNIMAQASRGADRNILLLRDILSQVSEPAAATAWSSRPSSQAKTMEVLVRLVSERLQDKRYFIIIDDICKASDWQEMKGAFPNNNLDSRVLITTRVTSIAWACCYDSYDALVHKIKPLNEKDSERLLLVKAVGSEDGCQPDNMVLFCDEILRRCDGIPLLITGMADLIRNKLQQLQQKQQKEHQIFDIHCEGLVPQLPEWVEQSLSFAFNNDFLNDNMRLLLLYMSMFPCGYKFEKDRLILKWIHEGLISSGIQYMECNEVLHQAKSEAETFFSQLVDRNVITCVASNCKHKQDEAEACQWQVNHFMHQFLVSRSAEMGFIFTSTTLLVAALSSAAGRGNETSSRMPRRLALALYHPDLPSLLETMDLSQTRSLVLSGTASRLSLENFVNLVVLDLEGWENLEDEDLLQVCRSKMILLSYLNVRNTRVSKLPHEIKELRILRTLDVSYTQISELPFELFELTDLCHLDLRGTRISQLPKQIVGLRGGLTGLLVGGEGTINSVEKATRLPHDVRRLYELETLATVDLTQHPASLVRALGDLRRLRVLAVTWSYHQSTDRDYCEALMSSIRKWKYLRSLTIHCGLGCSMEFLGSLEKSGAPWELEKFKVIAGRFASVPRWIDGLEHLAFMQITVCNKQAADDLKILGALAKLQCLILGLDFIPVQAMEIGNEGFRELQRFSVDCPMPWLTFKAGAMRKLTYLQLKLCAFPASNTEVPSGIVDLQCLTEVALCYNVRYANTTYIKETVKAVREAVAEHLNQVDLFINGIQDYDVQAVDEVTENAATRIVSGIDAGARADAQPVDEGTTSAAVQSEITEVQS